MEKTLTESKPSKHILTKEDLMRASKVFKDILLKCRQWVRFINPFRGIKFESTLVFFSEKHVSLHQGAVEGCCIGFTRFCASLLSNSDPEFRDIPSLMLKQVSGDTCLYVFFINTCRCWTVGLQICFLSCLFIGIAGCAVPSFYICDPAGCRVAYAHSVCSVSGGGQ